MFQRSAKSETAASSSHYNRLLAQTLRPHRDREEGRSSHIHVRGTWPRREAANMRRNGPPLHVGIPHPHDRLAAGAISPSKLGHADTRPQACALRRLLIVVQHAWPPQALSGCLGALKP